MRRTSNREPTEYLRLRLDIVPFFSKVFFGQTVSKRVRLKDRALILVQCLFALDQIAAQDIKPGIFTIAENALLLFYLAKKYVSLDWLVDKSL